MNYFEELLVTDQPMTRRKSVMFDEQGKGWSAGSESAHLQEAEVGRRSGRRSSRRAASTGTCSEYPTVCDCAEDWQCYRQSKDHVMGSRDINPDYGESNK
jgi:hypothetical protein